MKCVVIAALFAGLIDLLVGGGWRVTVAGPMLLPLVCERKALKVYTQLLECVCDQDVFLEQYVCTMMVKEQAYQDAVKKRLRILGKP